MTDKQRLKSQEDAHPLTTRIVDLILDENVHLKQARKTLGEGASQAKVKAEADKRMARARELNEQLVKSLGTSTRPFPMQGTERIGGGDGGSSLEMVFSVIADDANPLKVYSERPYREVAALAYCDLPVPGMLQLFFDGLERRRPESKNRTQMMIGDPGAGKSYLGGLQGRMRSKQPIEVYDCGGKNMNELLFEMVLDFGTGDALAVAIDKRLQAGALQGPSLGLLKDLPAKALSLDDGGNVKSVDWAYFKGAATSDEVHAAHEIITKVISQEGLDKGGGNALGMNSQYGPLIKWFIEGREGVLDEYNKSKEGSDNALQTVWQFFIGELDTCTVENPLKNKDLTSGPSSFTFRREDMQAGCFITLTGNKTEDGLTTRSLNKSVYSRLSPKTLPEPEVEDWQHRICQMMTGFPVSTWYRVYKDHTNMDPDKNPQEFGEWMLSQRREKARIEGVPVPELQETLLQNWQNVLHSSEKLARFYSDWANMTNAEKLTMPGSGNLDLMEEVDEEYSKKEGIDFRKIKQDLEEAIPIRPRMLPSDSAVQADFKNFDKQPVLQERDSEGQSASFGTRLVEYLENKVYEKSAAVGKEKLYDKLKAAMDDAGLRDVQLKEGARNKLKSVEEDLNVTVYDSSDLGKQALEARKVFCNFLREMDNRISTDDEQIITVERLKRSLAAVSEIDTAKTKELFIVNRDPETLVNAPLVVAKIEDATGYEDDQENPNFTLDDMVTHEDFMAALALPTVGAKNLAAIWDGNIRQLYQQYEKEDGKPDSDPDPALDIAENRSSLGLAVTSLRVLYEDDKVKGADGKPSARDVFVHVVLNTNKDKALVVGEKLPSKLQTAFKEAGIIYVNRHDVGAKGKIDAAIGELTRGIENTDTVKGFLTDAFKYRADVDVGRFMVDRKVITPQQLEAAQQRSDKTGEKVKDILINQGTITTARFVEIQAELNRIPLSTHMVDDRIEPMFGKYVIKAKGKKLTA